MARADHAGAEQLVRDHPQAGNASRVLWPAQGFRARDFPALAAVP